MKQATRLTRAMKEACTAYNLNWKEWLCLGETEFSYKLVHRETGRVKSLDKYAVRKRDRR